MYIYIALPTIYHCLLVSTRPENIVANRNCHPSYDGKQKQQTSTNIIATTSSHLSSIFSDKEGIRKHVARNLKFAWMDMNGCQDIEVSWNGGAPKSSILIRFPLLPPNYGNPHIQVNHESPLAIHNSSSRARAIARSSRTSPLRQLFFELLQTCKRSPFWKGKLLPVS